jgi:S1-C subfamily serine protease
MPSRILATLLSFAVLVVFAVKMPEYHNLFLRSKVGSVTYWVKSSEDGGGGTGFAIKAPSGVSYVLTNAHVCDMAGDNDEEPGYALVSSSKISLRRRIIAVSKNTDLCLIEGVPGVQGLSLGSKPHLGQLLKVVGHPHLLPLSISTGEVTHSADTTIRRYEITPNSKSCLAPKNTIVVSDKVATCFDNTKNALYTTAVIYPGNSGSPVVDDWGDVVGVLFATDNTTHWGIIVSLADVKNFLVGY